jgi:hypothetical protein
MRAPAGKGFDGYLCYIASQAGLFNIRGAEFGGTSHKQKGPGLSTGACLIV